MVVGSGLGKRLKEISPCASCLGSLSFLLVSLCRAIVQLSFALGHHRDLLSARCGCFSKTSKSSVSPFFASKLRNTLREAARHRIRKFIRLHFSGTKIKRSARARARAKTRYPSYPRRSEPKAATANRDVLHEDDSYFIKRGLPYPLSLSRAELRIPRGCRERATELKIKFSN